MPPKNKPETQQSPTKTVLDNTAQQPNSSAPVLPAPAPGTTNTGGVLDVAALLTAVTGLSSADTSSTSPDAVEAPELPRYQVTVVSSIQHDGTWYEVGDDIYLSDRDARGLLDGRFIVPIQESKQ